MYLYSTRGVEWFIVENLNGDTHWVFESYKKKWRGIHYMYLHLNLTLLGTHIFLDPWFSNEGLQEVFSKKINSITI